MPDRHLTIAAGMVSRLADVGARCGVDRLALLQEVQLDPDRLVERDNRIPVQRFARMWQVLGSRLPDRVLALEWAATWQRTDTGLFGYYVSQAANLGSALEMVCRYGKLVDEATIPVLHHGASTASIQYLISPVFLATQQGPEAVAATLVTFLRSVLGADFVPESVRLPTSRTGRTPALEAFFGRSVQHVNGASVRIDFPSAVLDRPLPGADPQLAGYLRKSMDELLAQVGSAASVSHDCARYIAERLGSGEPAQAAIARQMAMSERTLQRRLQAEGTSFQGILEETRRSIALGYLADRRFAAYEVSFMLGYSEPATFFRAFKRWTGQTPQQYRATAMHA